MNFVKEYFCLFYLAFCISILPVPSYALLKQITRYNSCSREFSALTKTLQPKKLRLTRQTNGGRNEGRKTLLSPVLRWGPSYKDMKALG